MHLTTHPEIFHPHWGRPWPVRWSSPQSHRKLKSGWLRTVLGHVYFKRIVTTNLMFICNVMYTVIEYCLSLMCLYLMFLCGNQYPSDIYVYYFVKEKNWEWDF